MDKDFDELKIEARIVLTHDLRNWRFDIETKRSENIAASSGPNLFPRDDARTF
jgi:hypothetical protein